MTFVAITFGPNQSSYKALEQMYGELCGRAGRFAGITSDGEKVEFDATITYGDWAAEDSSNVAVRVTTTLAGAEEGLMFFDTASQKGLLAPL